MQSNHQRRWEDVLSQQCLKAAREDWDAVAAVQDDSDAEQNMWLGFGSMWRHRQCPGLWERRGEGD